MKQRFLAVILLTTASVHAGDSSRSPARGPLLLAFAAASTLQPIEAPVGQTIQRKTNDRLEQVVSEERRAARAALLAAEKPTKHAGRKFPKPPRKGARNQLSRQTGCNRTTSRQANRKTSK